MLEPLELPVRHNIEAWLVNEVAINWNAPLAPAFARPQAADRRIGGSCAGHAA